MMMCYILLLGSVRPYLRQRSELEAFPGGDPFDERYLILPLVPEVLLQMQHLSKKLFARSHCSLKKQPDTAVRLLSLRLGVQLEEPMHA